MEFTRRRLMVGMLHLAVVVGCGPQPREVTVLSEAFCADGLDDDGDGRIDCDDSDCVDAALCDGCGNGRRDGPEPCDGDDLADRTCVTLGLGGGALGCRSDCRGFDTSGCGIGEVCGNGIDDDEDGLVDCADPICAGACRELVCDDGNDNDNNGATDCDDEECIGNQTCLETGDECDDGVDNDQDGLYDCDDPDCPPSTTEFCQD